MAITIAVDIDEVLGEFVAALARFHNARYGSDLVVADFHSYHFANVRCFGIEEVTHRKMLEYFDSPFFDELEPLPHAAAILRKHASDYNFVVVTSRSDTIEHKTRQFLLRHFAGIFDADVSCSSGAGAAPQLKLEMTNAYGGRAAKRTKGQVCRDIGAVALIDDSLHYAVEASHAVPFVLLHGLYPWNSGSSAASHKPLPHNVVRTKTWDDIDAVLTALTAARKLGTLHLSHSTSSSDIMAVLRHVKVAEAASATS